MGEVKRYTQFMLGLNRMMTVVNEEDYARLERERDEAVSVADSMGRDAVEFSAKLAEAQAELTRLRAVEKAAKAYVACDARDDDDISKCYYALAEAIGANSAVDRDCDRGRKG